MQFNAEDLRIANRRLGMLTYYPSDPGVQGAIMALLAEMCPSRAALDWLVDAMVNHVGIWKGPAELRGVLCWRFRPADGIEMDCSIAGFTSADGERLSIEQHEERRAIERGEPKRGLLVGYFNVVKMGRIQ